MSTLSTELRKKLERTIVQAREVAEAGAKAALETLAVHHHEPYGHMSPEERKLRNHLRARARQLGDKQNHKGELEITHLVWECAYEHWHRMLFARFLAENDLLIEPEMGVAISLEECEELAKEEEKDLWTLASKFAQRMLPQIFRPDDPILDITFAREHRLKLEQLLDGLEPAIFKTSDSIGWVYQFWQSKRKKEVNESENKIGADELPAVTQLFTEPYMVSFLLDNSLGAWWAARRLTEADLKNAENEDELRKKASLPGMPLEYLRFVKPDNGAWTPAAGTFDGWPEHLSELKTLDPCCGSGHFLVAAFLMLVPMRMEMEGLSASEATDAVLRENIHGLELDQRCVELAAFALALTAWLYPDAGGYRPLPELNMACTGLAISAKKEEWIALAGDNTNLRMALDELYKQFKDAPVLGSLINPEASLGKSSLFELKWEDVSPLLTKALSGEKDDEKAEMRVVAAGLSKAAKMFRDKYDWLITNVPYKTKGDLTPFLQEFIEKNYQDAKAALETAFLDRCLHLSSERGVVNVVMPQNMLFLSSYIRFRKRLLIQKDWHFVAWLGEKAFRTPLDVAPILISLGNSFVNNGFVGIDVSNISEVESKDSAIRCSEAKILSQDAQIKNPDHRVSYEDLEHSNLLSKFAFANQGIPTSDSPLFVQYFWEQQARTSNWEFFQSTVPITCVYGGRKRIVLYENGQGMMRALSAAQSRDRGRDRQGKNAWKKKGISVSLMGTLSTSLYDGNIFDINISVITPKHEKYLLTIWTYCSSYDFDNAVRKIDKKRNVTVGTLVKVSFDLDHWTKVAEEKYPNGLPKPYSDDSTQWIFHGHPAKVAEASSLWNQRQDAAATLQVAIARLLGYQWPAELDVEMELSHEQREWVTKCADLLEYVDEDGIVCISSMRGEEPAADRLREILSVAFGQDWSPAREQELIKATGANTAAFDDWLRDHFFEQHCRLFYHRPFIWHIWDGRRRDGFHALVNYHKLAEGNGKGRQLLENLTYSYLGDWITRQKEGVKQGEGGAEDRLAAALELQKRLIAIIKGEPPFDIFIRWKPIEKQPIGWEPDINNGVRLNIRPFMAQDIPGGRKGAGILRWKPNIKWNKDRGKEPSRPREQYPWFWKNGEFTGNRVNDVHFTNAEKRQATGKDRGKELPAKSKGVKR